MFNVFSYKLILSELMLSVVCFLGVIVLVGQNIVFYVYTSLMTTCMGKAVHMAEAVDVFGGD